jgi:hypothetical protein
VNLRIIGTVVGSIIAPTISSQKAANSSTALGVHVTDAPSKKIWWWCPLSSNTTQHTPATVHNNTPGFENRRQYGVRSLTARCDVPATTTAWFITMCK